MRAWRRTQLREAQQEERYIAAPVGRVVWAVAIRLPLKSMVGA
jgi:hypothetical protein